MNPELPSSPAFSALPVRRRETLEIFDTALKLYRRYFWVLLGWSALVSCLALVPFFSWFSLFTMPLLYGAVSCCVAAAVRGQSVKFSQCWAFTKPRYGPLLGTILLSYLVLFGVLLTIYIAGILVGLLGAWALSSAPQPVQIVGAVVGILLGLVVFSVFGVVSFGWTNMVPVVVCLEDDKRSTAALGRAFELLKGQWRRVFGLCLILGLAVMAVFFIVGAIYLMFGVGAATNFFADENAIWGLFATFGAFLGLFFLVWYPAQTLVIAVLYLDLRVRREALDLEWTAYASAPAPNLTPAPADFSLPATTSPATPENQTAFPDAASTPASFSAGSAETSGETPAPFPPPNEPKSELSSQPPSEFPSGENEARRD